MSRSRNKSRRLSGKVTNTDGMDMIDNADFNEENQENSGFGVNNDQAEKKNRRRSRQKNRRRSARFSLGGKGVRKTNVGEEQSVLTDFELTSMYKATIEMSTQNKINSKNAFQLQLIDRINQVVDVVTGNGSSVANENAFQHAGCVVEAAAKIYDARVEETYKNTQRFVADLARSNMKNGEEQEIDDDDATASDSAKEAAKARRSKRLGVAKTLETNLNSINICKSDLECDVNPLFEKMSQKFDEGGARGLLLGNVPISDGPKIVIGGLEPVVEKEESEEDDDDKESNQTENAAVEPMMFLLQMDTSALCKAASTRKLCSDTPAFYNWYDKYAGNDNTSSSPSKNGADMEQNVNNGASSSSSGMNMDDDDDDFDAHAGGDGDMYDAFGGDDFGDDFGLCDDGNTKSMGMGNNNNKFNNNDFQDDGPSVATNGSSAYSYYEVSAAPAQAANWTNKKSNWAGQGHNKHWKLFDTPSTSGSSSTKGGKKQKTPKETFVMDFTAEPIDVKKAFATSRAATTQSQKSLDAQHSDLQSYLLPDDAHYEMKDLQRLFFRPTAFVRAASGNNNTQQNDNDDNGFGDMTNGARDDNDDFGGDDWGDDNMAFGEDASASVFVAPQNDDDLDLVDDANLTEKIDIGYATTRKVFDIKQLKGEFWSHLSTTAPVKPDCKEVFENIQEESQEIVNEKIEKVFDGAATFTGTLDKVGFFFFFKFLYSLMLLDFN